ncbi:MAG: hypothetical protein H7Z16_03085 [Pyrinomonadaceae bacterium]|nr:hypothetical protein [Pyrinomonadaceae bacterium]
MNELLKAAARFCWTITLFGASQLGETFSRRDPYRATAAFDAVTRATEGELGDVLKRVFQAGDRLQQGLCDLAPALLTPGAYTSRGMMRTSLKVVQQSAAVLGALAPSVEARASLQEFQNKLEVFDLFENVDTVLRIPRGVSVPLAQLVEHASGRDTFTAVWATEGIGHFFAETIWEANGTPRGLLQGTAARSVPARTLAALHAGMGLSVANRILARVKSQSSQCHTSCDLPGALMQFLALCRDNSTEGYVGAAYEAMGLVARNLYPHMVNHLHTHLSEMGEALTEYFWHGVGRGIYFSPINYFPLGSSSFQAMEMARREPPDERSRGNALAGLVWAQLLVNLRQPEIVEGLLAECSGPFEAGAFANGVSSATVIWRDSTDGDPHLEALCRYRPQTLQPELAARWRELVEIPCRRALDEYYDILKDHDCVGEVFRVRPLPQLMRDLRTADNPAKGQSSAGGSANDYETTS